MSVGGYTRRWFATAMLAMPFGPALAKGSRSAPITDFGAIGDGATLNTKAIQAAIEHFAKRGGGTVIVPQGVFVSGALFLRPGVHLNLDKGAVLQCSTDLSNFPVQRTRIEGHFEEAFNPALINASGCDGLRISGQGTLDGAGRQVWDLFWKLRAASSDPRAFRNVGLPRARLALIENSKRVTVEGITFKDSQFWNLHLYKCRDVLVRGARFVVPDDYRQAPSTDGIDLDSCQHVTVDGCYFSVTDDCIAAKGSKGPHAMADKDSPPVEHIRVRNCVFKRGGGVLTCGSEATIVRDVLVENCRVIGDVKLAQLKLRGDTPQHYENIEYRNITVDAPNAMIVSIQPWTQYFDLKGEAPPKSIVRGVRFVGIKGRFGSLGVIKGNPGQSAIGDILFKDIDVTLKQDKLTATEATGLRFENVVINGKAVAG